MYTLWYTYYMPNPERINTERQNAFSIELARRWPMAKGSLAEVRKPCIRPRCRACVSGDKHPAYLLSFTREGRRRCMYVPARLVALIGRALKNGRRIEDLLYQMGPALIREHRQSRGAKKTSNKRVTLTKSDASTRKTKRKS